MGAVRVVKAENGLVIEDNQTKHHLANEALMLADRIRWGLMTYEDLSTVARFPSKPELSVAKAKHDERAVE